MGDTVMELDNFPIIVGTSTGTWRIVWIENIKTVYYFKYDLKTKFKKKSGKEFDYIYILYQNFF